MAKIDSIELNINGDLYKYNINVGKQGIFKCELHANVASILGLKQRTITSTELNKVKAPILNAYHQYLEATTEETLYIQLRLNVARKYAKDANGVSLLLHNDPIAQRGFSDSVDHVGFNYDIIIEEKSSTGVTSYYKATKGTGNINFYRGSNVDELFQDKEKYYKQDLLYGSVSGKLIPFSIKALNMLKTIEKGFTNLGSELVKLYKAEDTEALLTQSSFGNLLT